jgi:hypothetical protein
LLFGDLACDLVRVGDVLFEPTERGRLRAVGVAEDALLAALWRVCLLVFELWEDARLHVLAAELFGAERGSGGLLLGRELREKLAPASLCLLGLLGFLLGLARLRLVHLGVHALVLAVLSQRLILVELFRRHAPRVRGWGAR